MLQLYSANKTEDLAFVISELMKTKPLAEVFASETILIQSHGMGTWLQQQISTHLGIAAMIDCRMPASFIWSLAQDLMPHERLIPGFEKKNLRWQIFERLPEKLTDVRYQPLKDYLEAFSQAELPLFQLSERIADIYDGYQNYRTDWIAAWEAGKTALSEQPADKSASLADLEAWQADLWRSLYPEEALDDRKHRPSILQKLNAQLDSLNATQQADLPERIFIFGLSALPPHWLPIVLKLSRYCEVHFLIQNPCRFYWGDILCESQALRLQQALVVKGVDPETAASSFLEGNPLLASWGQQGRDYLSILLQHKDINEVPVDLYDPPDESDSALASLQGDILNLQAIERPVKWEDNSIRFARCHSAVREVEALQDYLFSLMDQVPDLAPRDIIVMMPEVQDFAALIAAVFSRPAYDTNGQAHYLPYGISDQLLGADQPMIEVLHGVLNLASLRVTSTEVLDWLDIDAIRSRFDIGLSDLPQIHHWLEALSIRWGLSEAHRDKLLAEAHPELTCNSGQGNTWLSAFKRLIAGYLYGDSKLLQDGAGQVLPYCQHSTETQILAGKLMRFVDVIEQTQAQFRGQHTVAHWLQCVSLIWSRWFDPVQLSAEIQSLMVQSLSVIEEQIQYAGFTRSVAFRVVLEALSAYFQQEPVSQRFLAGRINFCTLMPMRSIPFKVVCMIGMNEGHYPRPESRTGFDLMGLTSTRLGDRSRREDDRYLFLEALCSARDHLYISYCGNDAQDNSTRYPSLLVSELRDYCGQYFYLSSDDQDDNQAITETPTRRCENLLAHWTVDHRLQAFQSDYFRPVSTETRLPQSYSSEWLPLFDVRMNSLNSAEPLVELPTRSEIPAPPLLPDLELEQLVRFADHPLRYYYQKVLGLFYGDLAAELEDSEPFNLSSLDEYQLKLDLAQSWCEPNASVEQLFERWQASDRLPRPPVGRMCFDAVLASATGLQNALVEFDDLSLQAIALETPAMLVHGSILISNRGQIELSVSSQVANRFFGFWVRHVCWNLYRARHSDISNATSGCSFLLSLNHDLCLPELDEQQAACYLQEILAGFTNTTGLQPFLPRSTYALLFESASKVSSAFYGVTNQNLSIAGERDDPYWRRACELGALKGICQVDVLPDLESTVFYRQVATHLSGIEMTKR